MSIICDGLEQSQKVEIERILLTHLNSEQIREASLIINFYLNNEIHKYKLSIIKDTIMDSILFIKSDSVVNHEIIYISHNGLKNNFLSIGGNSQNINLSDPHQWMRQNILNRFLASSVNVIHLEIGVDKKLCLSNQGILKNNNVRISDIELDKLYKKILFSFNNIQVDVFAEWFNNLYKDITQKQNISISGGKFLLQIPVFSSGGGNIAITNFKLKKDSFDNLLFFYNNHTIESGEFIKENFNLCCISPKDGKLKIVRLFGSKDDTAYYNERDQDSLLLNSYKK